MSALKRVLILIPSFCLLAGALSPPAAAQTVVFGLPRSTPTGAAAEDLAAGDWNGDGKIDLAVANRDDGTISILLNNGSAVFTLKQLVTFLGTNPRPFEIIAAHLNGDSVLDLAVALEGTDQVAVLIGNGDGTFAEPATYAVGNTPVDLAAGDFDGQTGLDLITANEEGDSVSILLNNGDGTFGQATEFGVIDPDLNQRARPKGVAVGDFNKDGMLDFAAANFARNHVAVLLQNADWTFSLWTYDTAPLGEPWAIVAADLNADNNLDLTVANMLDDNVSVLLGVGDGTFAAAVNYNAGNAPEDVIAADIDGDGKLDLVTANREGDNVSVLLGNGNGTFKAASESVTGGAPTGVVAADFNGDGKVDLATANEEHNDVTVLLAGAVVPTPTLPQCPGVGCGPMGLMPYALLLCGLMGLKRYGRRHAW
jgi:hypothetical protein